MTSSEYWLPVLLPLLFACQWMVTLVRKAKLKYFSYYGFVVGTLAIAYRFTC
jgi:undecaprenyl-diphosphatase